ncbi:MAG: type II toxin-antitoxin system HicB family antitoxin [Candidatus Paceibacterota bacterium]|jgi:predicted RNase H-like HicB family nuclease
MISEFVENKLKNALYKILEDKTYFGEIKGVKGVWANAKTLESCRAELREVLEDWILLQVRNGNKISGLPLSFDRRKDFSYA